MLRARWRRHGPRVLLCGMILSAAIGMVSGGCGSPASRPLLPTVQPLAQPDLASDDLGCPTVHVMESGEVTAAMCEADARARGLTVIDLSDGWAPRIFAPEDPYREEFVRLTRGEPADGLHSLEVYGIFPAPSVVKARLLDERRHACHRDVEAETDTARARAHLVCDGLLEPSQATASADRWDARTTAALHTFQRRNFLLEAGELGESTLEALRLDSRELDYRALLRSVRERVADATGWIEDGTADNRPQTVLGRHLDPDAMLRTTRPPVDEGAPDLLSEATQAVAEALGWTSPEAAVEELARTDLALRRVAIELPPSPAYHAAQMDLKIVIDRGDVWYDPPVDGRGRRRPQPIEHAPVLLLQAFHEGREVTLVRWSTTIGGWQREEAGGEVGRRYKESPVGARVVRSIFVAPAWLPPQRTPDDELMIARDGRWVANTRLMERGWASAFGLVMLVHEHEGSDPSDEGIRTHGTSAYQTVLEGTSHGCHRLWNHMAMRLAGFVLAHREHESKGIERVAFERQLRHEGDRAEVTIRNRGWRYDLASPLPVEVLEGRVRGRLQAPPRDMVDPVSP